MRILFILFICLGTLLPAQAAPKQEIRASWITTLGGLDWPSQKATSPAGIERQKKNYAIYWTNCRKPISIRCCSRPVCAETSSILLPWNALPNP